MGIFNRNVFPKKEIATGAWSRLLNPPGGVALWPQVSSNPVSIPLIETLVPYRHQCQIHFLLRPVISKIRERSEQTTKCNNLAKLVRLRSRDRLRNRTRR